MRSAKTSRKTKVRRQPIELSFPGPDEWQNIVSDCKLTPTQADTLKFTIDEALDEIRRHQVKLKNEPNRALLIDRLKKFDKALNRLLKECRRSADLMNVFLPSNTLAYISESMSFSAMSEALGRNVFPIDFDTKTTLASLEQDSHVAREMLGLKHGHLILTHFLEGIHAQLVRSVEWSRRNQGGRQADAARRHLIYELAKEAPEIIGKRATIAKTGKFVDLCTAVLLACGLPESGIATAIPSVVRKLRAYQNKWHIGRAR
jgi:hypothetical protein